MELPYLAPQALAYTLLLYFMLGMRATAGGFFFAYAVVLASAAAMILLAQVGARFRGLPGSRRGFEKQGMGPWRMGHCLNSPAESGVGAFGPWAARHSWNPYLGSL